MEWPAVEPPQKQKSTVKFNLVCSEVLKLLQSDSLKQKWSMKFNLVCSEVLKLLQLDPLKNKSEVWSST